MCHLSVSVCLYLFVCLSLSVNSVCSFIHSFLLGGYPTLSKLGAECDSSLGFYWHERTAGDPMNEPGHLPQSTDVSSRMESRRCDLDAFFFNWFRSCNSWSFLRNCWQPNLFLFCIRNCSYLLTNSNMKNQDTDVGSPNLVPTPWITSAILMRERQLLAYTNLSCQ